MTPADWFGSHGPHLKKGSSIKEMVMFTYSKYQILNVHTMQTYFYCSE